MKAYQVTETDTMTQSFFSSFKKAEAYIFREFGVPDRTQAEMKADLRLFCKGARFHHGVGFFLYCTNMDTGKKTEVTLDAIFIR